VHLVAISLDPVQRLVGRSVSHDNILAFMIHDSTLFPRWLLQIVCLYASMFARLPELSWQGAIEVDKGSLALAVQAVLKIGR